MTRASGDVAPLAVSGWLDASVIVRHLTATPPDEAQRASALLQRAETGDLILKVHPVLAALTDHAGQGVDLPDAFLARRAAETETPLCYTFDKHFTRLGTPNRRPG